jgi:hypothetical protein
MGGDHSDNKETSSAQGQDQVQNNQHLMRPPLLFSTIGQTQPAANCVEKNLETAAANDRQGNKQKSGNSQKKGGNKGVFGFISNIVSSINLCLNLYDANGSMPIEYGKTIFSSLNTGLSGYNVYSQFDKGGWSKINRIDATKTAIGTSTLITKVMSWFGAGGPVVSFFGSTLSTAGLGVSSIQLWDNALYKPLNDLNFVPLYIDKNGEPFYGDQVPPGIDE